MDREVHRELMEARHGAYQEACEAAREAQQAVLVTGRNVTRVGLAVVLALLYVGDCIRKGAA